ncbi:hypothetical protein DGo_PB0475 (plasmid) [Deinococcus gobiensis I-0]|uniref:Uncharacterized protein n=1 Tax=Deinococcus gobiensis (strain DSM 21396 / JCM 16679 / CGMCC 1.7299 / I-0) TaxID=745776 RepID=H8H2J7_DEIGI|nr:hypothetical protein DGo_PB0475 [Deinococcus gobiensis I-0]
MPNTHDRPTLRLPNRATGTHIFHAGRSRRILKEKRCAGHWLYWLA